MIFKKKMGRFGLLAAICLSFSSLINAKDAITGTKHENWVLISKDSVVYRKIDKELKYYDAQLSNEEIYELIDRFNDAINNKLNEILVNMSKVMESKDMCIFTRMLHKRMKRAILYTTPKIVAKIINGRVVNVELLAIEFVQDIIREALLGI